MTLSKPKKAQHELPPKGNHVARLYEIIHIGTIPTTWKGEEKMTDKIRLAFELSNERKVFKDGDEPKPFSVSREFTYSFGNKGNLRPFVEGMTGTKIMDNESPDLEALVGNACLLNVVHTEKDGATYANIQGASPLPRGMEAPALFNEPRTLDINSIPFADIDALPEFLQKKMKSSEEYSFRVKHQTNLEEAGRTEEGAADSDTATPGKLQKPRILGGTDEPNPDDIPF